MQNHSNKLPVWSYVIPLLSFVVLLMAWIELPGWIVIPLSLAALFATVLVAVFHAEIIAHRIGEPFGTLVLALAVTLIELSLIISMMMSKDVESSELARDAVFSTIMIVCNGVIGLCLLLGSLRHHAVSFRVEGTNPALSVLATLATMSLVLPDFTFSTEGPTFSTAQLMFAGIVSLLLYGVFLFVQTSRHREHFLPEAYEDMGNNNPRPSNQLFGISLILLVVSLATVVGLAESIAPTIEEAVFHAGLPHSIVGVVIAMMVLLPETTSALRSAARNHMQISFNLALGSALASIGLTIPALAFTSIWLGLTIDLGLPPKELTLLVITFFLTSITLSNGRATILQGAVHLVVFAIFLFTAIVP